MPYIASWKRDLLDSTVNQEYIETCGDLNYLFTKLCITYLKNHGLSYQTCNDIVGALDNAKSEFKRRIQNKYEDQKMMENSDVYNIEQYFGNDTEL